MGAAAAFTGAADFTAADRAAAAGTGRGVVFVGAAFAPVVLAAPPTDAFTAEVFVVVLSVVFAGVVFAGAPFFTAETAVLAAAGASVLRPAVAETFAGALAGATATFADFAGTACNTVFADAFAGVAAADFVARPPAAPMAFFATVSAEADVGAFVVEDLPTPDPLLFTVVGVAAVAEPAFAGVTFATVAFEGTVPAPDTGAAPSAFVVRPRLVSRDRMPARPERPDPCSATRTPRSQRQLQACRANITSRPSGQQ